MALKYLLNKFSCFLDGDKHFADIENLGVPDLEAEVEEIQSGLTKVEVPVGLKRLESTFTFVGYDPEVFKHFSIVPGKKMGFVVRGSIQSEQNGEERGLIITMRGQMLKAGRGGTWEPNKNVRQDGRMSLSFYKEEIDGREVFYWDHDNSVLRIDGEDQLSQMRDNLGL